MAFALAIPAVPSKVWPCADSRRPGTGMCRRKGSKGLRALTGRAKSYGRGVSGDAETRPPRNLQIASDGMAQCDRRPLYAAASVNSTSGRMRNACTVPTRNTLRSLALMAQYSPGSETADSIA